MGWTQADGDDLPKSNTPKNDKSVPHPDAANFREWLTRQIGEKSMTAVERILVSKPNERGKPKTE